MSLQIAALFVGASLLVAPMRVVSQENTATAPHTETENELDARLTLGQRQQFDAAKKAQQATHYEEALAGFKALLQAFPGDSLLTKWTSDAAIEMGNSAYAASLLKPLVQQNFEDWQAVSMLARAAAESGDRQTRDAAMFNMAMLRQHGLNLPQYTVERLAVGQNAMTVRCFLIPFGPYKAYYIGRVTDPKGFNFLTISLESSDADQLQFAKEHAQEAAAGVRVFTLDAYRETGLNPAGQRTQSHFTYKFFCRATAIRHSARRVSQRRQRKDSTGQ